MIFEDPSRRRWRRAKIAFALAAGLGLFLLADLLAQLVTHPPLPAPDALRAGYGTRLDEVIAHEETAGPAGSGATRAKAHAKRRAAYVSPLPPARSGAVLLPPGRPVDAAFLIADDPAALASFQDHADAIDVLFPDGPSLVSGTGCSVGKSPSFSTGAWARAFSGRVVPALPRFSDFGDDGKWQGEAFLARISDDDTATCLARSVVASVKAAGAQGANLDVEGLPPSGRDAYSDWLAQLAGELHRAGLYLSVDVPMQDEAFDYELIGGVADAVVLMAYDEHFAGGAPGPVASQDWFDGGVDAAVARVPKSKLIVAMAAYGYDWEIGSGKPASALAFDEIMALAGDVGADVQSDSGSANPEFAYRDASGSGHAVWFMDAVSGWNQWWYARKAGVAGTAFWRLGMEDPTMWTYVAEDAPDAFDPSRLAKSRVSVPVLYDGRGELLRVTEAPAKGLRDVSLDGRRADSWYYATLPEPFVVRRYGAGNPGDVLLTFDDGPDPEWTSKILDVLKKEGVPAAFFLVGDQAEKYPDMVQREYAEGHVVGNHTFRHPNIAQISDTRLNLELDSTQRTVESLLGRSTLLFRAPYDTDSTPTSLEQLSALRTVYGRDYVTVGGNVDSEDYDKPGTGAIVRNVLGQVDPSEANIVVMHDAGGDRAQTVEALPQVIKQLRDKGYRFVSISDLVGVPRDSLMPAVPAAERLMVTGERVVIFLRTWGWFLVSVLFLFSTAFSVLRIVFLGWFVLRTERTKPVGHPAGRELVPVSVLVPAFNEEKVIDRTIEKLLASDHPAFEVLVIDDGSTDATAARAEAWAARDGRVRVVRKPNGGKADALNVGMREAKWPHVATVDADTVVFPDTLRRLCEPFADASVDAVCGNVEVGNVRNLLTAFQEVEYVTSQNYDRRAFDALNAISVVPGATGAWKRDKVLALGGYSHDTLTEDADLTMSLLAAGGRITYATQARSVTEAPETVRALFKQRFRWAYGTFQCLWKHRRQFGRGALGKYALPNMLVFQVVFPVLSPLGDLIMVMSLFRSDFGAFLAGYLLFLSMDAAGSAIAFSLEKKPLWKIWVVVIQRFFYRQFMYLVCLKGIFSALRGRRKGWNKLVRTGNAQG